MSLNLPFFFKTGFDALHRELPATNTHKLIYKKNVLTFKHNILCGGVTVCSEAPRVRSRDLMMMEKKGRARGDVVESWK